MKVDKIVHMIDKYHINLLLTGEKESGKSKFVYDLLQKMERLQDTESILIFSLVSDRSFKVVRNKLCSFLKLFSIQKKIIIIHNFDELNAEIQACIATFMRKYAKTTIFILITANLKVILDNIYNYCVPIDVKSTAIKKKKLNEKVTPYIDYENCKNNYYKMDELMNNKCIPSILNILTVYDISIENIIRHAQIHHTHDTNLINFLNECYKSRIQIYTGINIYSNYIKLIFQYQKLFYTVS